jgi:GTP-binding nuclear protein Ran
MQQYKIILVGDAGVGKTTFIARHTTGRFDINYIPTIGVAVRDVLFMTNHGEIQFNVWDLAGQEKFGGSYDGYYQDADGAIAMFDGRTSMRGIGRLVDDIKNIAGDVPISVCGNKCDLRYNQAMVHDFDRIGVKNDVNIDAPFLDLARQLTGHADLVFQ